MADEAVGVRTLAESEGEADEVVGDATTSSVQNVGQHDVHGVLGAHGSGTQHCESQLHGKHQVSRVQQVGIIHCPRRRQQLRRHRVQFLAKKLTHRRRIRGRPKQPLQHRLITYCTSKARHYDKQLNELEIPPLPSFPLLYTTLVLLSETNKLQE